MEIRKIIVEEYIILYRVDDNNAEIVRIINNRENSVKLLNL